MLICHENFHSLKLSNSIKKAGMALKLDMKKAYDRVNWSFFKQILLNLGFHEHWVKMVMDCVKSVSYSFLINGNSTRSFVPSRDLRQGDSISPYLFILYAEGLFAMIQEYERKGFIHGCKIARGTLMISHLFFADDSSFFFKATERECSWIL